VREPLADLRSALEEFGELGKLEDDELATRNAYGYAPRALGRADPRIVALDGDVRNWTYSELFKNDPELGERLLERRIAEQTMIGCAAGLAAAGERPIASSFGKFIARAYDQPGMALVGRLDLRIVGSHVDVSLAADGPSQMALSDVAFFHAWSTVRRDDGTPLIYMLCPADAFVTHQLTLKMAQHGGTSYMRTLRPNVPLIYAPEDRFDARAHRALQEGNNLLLAAAGYMVHEAQRARD